MGVESVPITRADVEAVQLDTYNDPENDLGYGIGPMQDALIGIRCRLAKEFVLISPQGPVLDLGCGQGLVSEAVSDLGRNVFGIDIANERVKDTSSQFEDHASLHFLTARTQELPFRDSCFAAVVAFELFEHLLPKDAELMMREIRRTLQPGGRLILSTVNTNSFGRRVNRLGGRIIGKSFLFDTRPDHFNEVSFESLVACVQKHGFCVTEALGLGILPGMWRIQNIVACKWLHEMNVKAGLRIPKIASEVVIVAKKETSP